MKKKIFFVVGVLTLFSAPTSNLIACDDIMMKCNNGEQKLLDFHYDPLKVKCVPMEDKAGSTLGELFEFCSTRGGVAYDKRVPNSGGSAILK